MAHLAMKAVGVPYGARVHRDYRPQASWGRGRIQMTVEVKTGPATYELVRRRVRLYRENDGMLLRELWSHPTTGAVSFDYVDPAALFTATAFDHTGNDVAVSIDKIVPEPMP